MRNAYSWLAALGLVDLLVGGCAPLPATDSDSLPAIAVLINSQWTEADPRGFTWNVQRNEKAAEKRFAACVRHATGAENMAIRVITGTRFRTTIFPDLSPQAAPRSWEVIQSLLPDPRFQSRAKAARIDYLAILGGETRTSETQGGISCAGGFGAGACLGLLRWDHDAKLSALVVDLRSGSAEPAPDIHSADSSWFAMLGIVPLGAPSSHEAQACERFGLGVANALRRIGYRGD